MSEDWRNEGGAVLVLALIFIIVTALVGVALATLTAANLQGTSGLDTKLNVEYAADGAVQGAIQNVRYSGASYPSAAQCFPATQSVTINGQSMIVYCVNAGGAPSGGRAIQFIACSSAASPSACTSVAADQDVTAIVLFYDLPQLGTEISTESWQDNA